ncbi:MAG: FAD-binding protein, partial [Candidatus Bathyarchaeota archaeon]|nr:FAD-binding protein [Candidatus Bathyarchaeota archaeon]
MVENIDSDVVVVGSGGAGLRAAIEADERGAMVVVVSKAPAGMNNATVVAGGGFRAAIEGLTPEEHYEDTIRVGNRINDRRLVEIFAHEGGERVLELRRFGVEMRIHKGGISVGDTPRLMGLGMTKPMVEHLRERGVRIVENVVVTKLLASEGRIMGAVGYDVRNDHPVIFQAKAVVLATGGGGALYKRTDCPLRTTGDGYSLAYHAGVRLRDMEFVQFFPVALAEPGSPPFLLGGPITEEGRLLNRLGEDIPEKHGVTTRPLVLKSRGPLSVAIMREILAGNGVEGAVFLDATEVIRKYGDEDWFSSGRFAYLRDKLKAGERPVKVAPICHFFMGGVIADENGDTGVAGLYAAGEAVGGVHGANRHGGNALTDITVFGARAGATVAEYSRTQTMIPVD